MGMRRHGCAPWRVVAVHGGPGGIGSAGAWARELAARAGIGVLEPWQSEYSVEALIGELHGQIVKNCAEPPVVIGHSWGAWLAGLTLARHPGGARKLILVAAGALDEAWLETMNRRRLERFSASGRARYRFLCEALARPDTPGRDALLAELGALCESADDYAPLPEAAGEALCDGKMYARVWREAAALRHSGELARCFAGIGCPLTVIHGAEDPTPPESVTGPLRAAGVAFEGFVLERCGHNPWREQWAREAFFTKIEEEL